MVVSSLRRDRGSNGSPVVMMALQVPQGIHNSDICFQARRGACIWLTAKLVYLLYEHWVSAQRRVDRCLSSPVLPLCLLP